ncbi:diguanylate cyclase domain-containing protein [Ectothiorhodospira mobilis]|uniref:diguanylate cyclase domain-containing protein n=1 Tax=Ectothiorhodospira mobilis TaxID=195064 RepID=UPI001EE80DF6|nr:diguanylate cyclase [Ectothiorhodospira mobilis]MCG5534654.1 diguanylate cyclase [Ectothiorhodospira mobilis]
MSHRHPDPPDLEALQESESRLRALVDGGPALIWTSGTDGQCDWFNRVWLAFTGRTLEEEWGYGWTAGVHPDDLGRCVETYTQAFERREPFSMDYRLRHHSGEYRWIQDDGQPRYSPRGAFLGYIGHCLDITRRKHVETINRLHGQVLQQVLDRAALTEILATITRGIEHLLDDCWASIELLETDGRHLHLGAAPGLPQGFRRVCQRIPVGEGNGACGTAAALGRRVIAADIATHPHWQDFRQDALREGIAACWSEPVFDSRGQVIATFAIYRPSPGQPDAAEIQTVEAFSNLTRLAIEQCRQQQRLVLSDTVFHAAGDAIFVTDGSGRILDVNPAFTTLTGHRREAVLGQDPSLLKSGRHGPEVYAALWRALQETGEWQGELWNRRRDGSLFAAHTVIRAVPGSDGEDRRYVVVLSDITERLALEARLEHNASHDPLTDLPNRAVLQDRLQQAMAHCDRHPQDQVAVLYMDLDGFKAVNDRFGHAAGDRLLVAAGRGISACLRQGDTLARLGGDEFAGILVDLDGPEAVHPILERILTACRGVLQSGPGAEALSVSIGVTFYPQDAPVDTDDLLRQADNAMYRAKQAGRDRYCLHT